MIPAARFCPDCKEVLSVEARACACGWRQGGKLALKDGVDLTCQWNDYGRTCGRRGSMSDGTDGKGPWWCSEHYWKRKGRPVEFVGQTLEERDAAHLQDAKNYCYDRGLDTVDKMRAFIKEKVRVIGKKQFDRDHWVAWAEETVRRPDANMVAIERAQQILAQSDRVPGEDREEV